MTIPRSIEDAIYRCDLTPSRARVHGKIAASVGRGGLVSLFFCGPFGLGITATAGMVHGAIMARTGTTGCAAICGVLFAAVPFLSLRPASGPMLFPPHRYARAIAMRRFVVEFRD